MWILDELYERRNSDTFAVIERKGCCTFRELWERSEHIARDILREVERSGKDTPIVLYGDKHHDMIPAMLAALKTGRAYVPVDVTFPVERLSYIAKATDSVLIYNFSGKTLDIPFTVRDGTALEQTLYKEPAEEDISRSLWVKDDDPCYILFTSGSTGAPKGVPIRKRNIVNYVTWFSDFIRPGDYGQNVLNQASYSCDFSVEILYVYMSMGKTLICVDKGLIEDVGSLLRWLSENKISVWSSTPSFMEMCGKDPALCKAGLPELQLVIMGGEAFGKNTAKMIRSRFPDVALFNTYGPTEVTVEFVACRVTDEMIESERSIPIGKVMPEAKYWVENENGDRCAEEEVGELVAVSKSCAEGYFLNPEQTKKVFFRSEDGRMGYHTGDLVYEKDGLLYFAGRKDSQVKVGGYRIEIDDIAANLDQLDEVETSAVVPVRDENGTVSYLAAFIKRKASAPQRSSLQNLIVIKKGLAEKVPSYMIPRKVIFVEEFPLNNTGKIDKKALAASLEKK